MPCGYRHRINQIFLPSRIIVVGGQLIKKCRAVSKKTADGELSLSAVFFALSYGSPHVQFLSGLQLLHKSHHYTIL